eukprot:gene9792-6869_t
MRIFWHLEDRRKINICLFFARYFCGEQCIYIYIYIYIFSDFQKYKYIYIYIYI